MKLSTRSRYGVRLVLDMALHRDEGPIRLGLIAKRQGVPLKYLEQIIIPLKKSGYIASVRGPKGGHLLTKPPEKVTVGEIVILLEGGIDLTRCVDRPEGCVRSVDCVTRCLWRDLTESIMERLDSITFADLVRASTGVDDNLGCSPDKRRKREHRAQRTGSSVQQT